MSHEAATLVHKRITLNDMWDACADIAREIEVSEGAMVKAGFRLLPDPAQMRRAEILTNICRFIEVVREVEPELRALVARRRGWTKGGRE